ncbi:NitT/TauT family transport system substrate-binding protein [Natronocella acetinitrilica]|uniref:NitT/TauT family transport system substrate-binding protein n=1 Tax=Natronocella acetinitrilica TaxID=414046 RepID=A0AAE3KEH0_9GAMM|nr:putative urea ABC transporter substrate-binding protein [Natronocella acetinitrilica]MCP1673072.1 NitT/TauT family transport system substrate-binding protein [Natronocella acetinitrilica]
MQSLKHAFQRYTLAFLVSVGLLTASAAPVQAQERDSFRIAWSIYVGWMPWGYGAAEGIVQKWADKYGIEIEVVQINDYIESINLYTAGSFDGVTATNMDALTIPAASGVDTTALIVGDFSDGNDGVVLKGTDNLEDIAGKRVHLVELSVSHYLLARALESVGMTERDIRVVNTSDADIVAAFTSSDVEAIVTWNPQLGEVRRMPEAEVVFDSSQIPGEIMDLLVVNSDVLEANPDFGKALAGAWYEIMSIMSGDDEAGEAARADMGEAAGTDLAGYEAQLASTTMFYDPAEAVDFVESELPAETMENVRQFAFEHGLLGENAPSPDFVGIQFADGSVLGSEGNVRFRFNADYMRMARDGEL